MASIALPPIGGLASATERFAPSRNFYRRKGARSVTMLTLRNANVAVETERLFVHPLAVAD
jgi:hypothetical protein